MMRRFNTSGPCVPALDYMVDISGRVDEVSRDFVGPGRYFVVNRARQYGKTTMLEALSRALAPDHLIVHDTFAGRPGLFDSAYALATGFSRTLARAVAAVDQALAAPFAAPIDSVLPFDDLSDRITRLCATSPRPVILIVDEVDKAAEYDTFAALLGLFRDMYIQRRTRQVPTFHSVILAGVHDVRNLKRKIRPDAEHVYNSPWNIAVPFTIDMSLSALGISGMLDEYARDSGTVMDSQVLASGLRHLTAGYPFLVSRLCEIIDICALPWTDAGLATAVNRLLHERNTLFDDLVKNLDHHPALTKLVENILVKGEDVPFNQLDPAIDLGVVYGILADRDGQTIVANRIFETLIYNYLVSVARTSELLLPNPDDHTTFIRDGELDMFRLVTRFSDFLRREYRTADGAFMEDHARLIFLGWISPVINGSGHYYVEAEVRKNRRMDVVIAYGGKEHIVELKIWSGPADHEKAYDQLCSYLDARSENEGWLITLTNQVSAPTSGTRRVIHHGHTIWDTIIAYAQD